jgi:hypothetical protein
MSNAYRFVFECPNGHSMNMERKCRTESISEAEVIQEFGNEELSCAKASCGWHGKASNARLLRILPFNWVVSG